MRLPLKLLKKENFQLKLRLIEQKNHNVSFGWTLKLCILLMVITWKSALACWGGGYTDEENKREQVMDRSKPGYRNVDEKLFINLTGIKDPMERIIKTAWRGFIPDPAIQKEWKKWYDEYHACKALHEGTERKKKKKGQAIQGPLACEKYGFPPGTGRPGGSGGAEPDFNDEDRGPGSNWPNLPGWRGLGPGSPGTPIPPWSYAPKNTGKPSVCYLGPVRGICRNDVIRWAYNPYMNRCDQYIWGGCGGTRNKFTTKKKCEEFCMPPQKPSCSVDSGIKATLAKRPNRD